MMPENACYNPPLPQILRYAMRPSRPSLKLLLSFLLFVHAVAHADSFSEGDRSLVQQISAHIGAGSAVALTCSNLSSLAPKQFEQVQRDLQSQLRAQGMKLVPFSQSVAEVRATLSENARGYLWVAQIRQGQAQEIVMVAMVKAESAPAAASSPPLTLNKAPLWSQAEPILDLAVLPSRDGKPHWLVLEPSRIALYRSEGGEPEAAAAILQNPWPRDLRGRLLLRRDRLFEAWLPGMSCSSAGQSISGAQCRNTDDPWPLTATDSGPAAFFSPSRNFFTGILSGAARGKSVAPFYSAARIEDGGQEVWMFAGVDGRLRFFNGMTEVPAAVSGWGSDLAALKTGCGSGWQVLATHAGDATAPDVVQAFEISGRDLVPASQTLEFAGPVTALWPAADNAGAVAVSRNLATGRYEAFALSISCGH